MHETKQRALFLTTLAAALLLGLTVQWPSLHGGFRGDDYVQRAMFRGDFPTPRSAFDLFSFAAGTPEDHKALVDFGHLPWWSHPELRLRMWRPLASALMALDFQLWDRDARLHHAHSLLWFCLLLIAAGRLLWRVLPPPAAAVAWLLFAASPCHTLPVGWLANRSTLIACTWAFVALELQLYARTRRALWPRLVCAAASCIALLCGEYALSALAYGLCFSALWPFEPSLPKPTLREQARDALPVLAPLCGYLVLHSLLGSDIVHSGYYISPLRSPVDFAAALVARVPVLSADLLFGLPSYYYHAGTPLRAWLLSQNLFSPEVWARLPDWRTWQVAIGYLALAFGLVLYLWSRRAPQQPCPPRWLVAGTLLSLVPCAGSLPEDRLLTAATLGSSALVACTLVSVARSLLRPPRTAAAFALSVPLIWLPISALTRSYDDVREIVDGSAIARAWCLLAELPSDPKARVYLLNTPDFNSAVNLPWLRLLEADHAPPSSYRRLSPSPMPVRVQRVNERTIDLRMVTSEVYGAAVPSLYRDASSPVRPGERHELPGLVVTVLETYAGNPVTMRFELDRPLEDPGIWFLAATEHGLRRQELPAIGADMLVPYAQYRDLRR